MNSVRAGNTLHEIFRLVTERTHLIPVTEVRERFPDTVTLVAEADRPKNVTNHGKPVAVILSYETLSDLQKVPRKQCLTWEKLAPS